MIKVNTADEFLEKGTFLIAEDKKNDDPPYKYMHDDYNLLEKQLKEFKKEHGDVYGYTLVDGEGNTLILVKGFRWVNRLGYFVTKEDIHFKEDELLY